MKRAYFLLFAILLTPLAASAVAWNDPLGGQTIQQGIGSVIRVAIGYIGILGLLGFLFGGFKWMTAGGDSKKVADAKEIMVWTVVGMFTVFIAYAAVNFVVTTLTATTGITNP